MYLLISIVLSEIPYLKPTEKKYSVVIFTEFLFVTEFKRAWTDGCADRFWCDYTDAPQTDSNSYGPRTRELYVNEP